MEEFRMSWTLFIDESGQDRRQSPYEVLAGVAVEDRKLWPLIRQFSDLQNQIFGIRYFEGLRKEAKATKLLNRRVFRFATRMDPIKPDRRRELALENLEDGANADSLEHLTALGQAKIAYCEGVLATCRDFNVALFASIVPKSAPRPPRIREDAEAKADSQWPKSLRHQSTYLRKDYAYLFERFYYFLNKQSNDPMGYLVFDELDRSASHILLTQVAEYFQRTVKGKSRSRLIIPEPFFVHSDLTTLVQVADLVAYVISWGVKLPHMNEPRREELSGLARAVMRLRFTWRPPSGHPVYGFKVIPDLRAQEDQ